MRDSFVVGVTPDGRRHPLFVGTIGAVRGFVDAAKQAGGVVDGTWYPAIRWSEDVSPTDSTQFSAAPGSEPPKPQPQTSAVNPPAASPRKKREPRAPTNPPKPTAESAVEDTTEI